MAAQSNARSIDEACKKGGFSVSLGLFDAIYFV